MGCVKMWAKEGKGNPWQPEDLPDFNQLMDNYLILS